MKFISSKTHGIIDFLVVFFLLASPMLFGMNGLLAIFTYALGIVHLTLTLLTDFSAGVLRIIPLKIHGVIELIVGIALIILALTLFKDSGLGKVYYICFGGAVLLTWLFTDYKVSRR
jgi:uncharacterized membrane protein